MGRDDDGEGGESANGVCVCMCVYITKLDFHSLTWEHPVAAETETSSDP